MKFFCSNLAAMLLTMVFFGMGGWRIHGGFMANGFAKVDNGFGYISYLQGGCKGWTH
jgi:hypothetical protein